MVELLLDETKHRGSFFRAANSFEFLHFSGDLLIAKYSEFEAERADHQDADVV